MGHVILKEFYFPTRRAQRLLRRLRAPLYRPADARDAEGAHAAGRRSRSWCPTATCARRTSTTSSAQANNPEWKTVAFDESGKVVLPQRRHRLSLGPRRPRRRRASGISKRRKRARQRGEAQAVGARRRAAEQRHREGRLSRTSAASSSEHFPNNAAERDVLVRTVPVQRIALGKEARARGAGRHRVRPAGRATTASRAGCPANLPRQDFDDDTPYTPAWQERITGTPRAQVITVARQFAENARQDPRPLDGDHRRRR